MNVTLRQLRVFLAVAHERNFSRAGETVGLTQPAVSRSITDLEQQLGLELLHRSTREVELSDAGRMLQGRITRVLDELDAALLEVRGLATQPHGRVRVASSPTLSAHLMPQCIALCAQQHPGLQLQLLDRIQQGALDSVRAGEVDFGVVIDPTEPEDLHCETILSEPFCLVCPADHALVQLPEVHWRDLAGHPLVLLDHASGSRRLIDRVLEQHAPGCQVVQEVGHTTTIFSMVQAGLGVAVVPQLAVAEQGVASAQLAHRLLLPAVERQIMLVHRRHRRLAPVVQRVWDLVRGVAHARAAVPDAAAPRARARGQA
ncbi:LysR substrate-binding domain-containing protein [Comamonas antarctica]|uniref:LysR family transcriptional regulator n=1 Tax=Comamonas antarctica TaxID=2743470 RepID=UPI0028E44FA7|nr:LysR substrate-binding domain-containing protein [Comamonas antarctica]